MSWWVVRPDPRDMGLFTHGIDGSGRSALFRGPAQEPERTLLGRSQTIVRLDLEVSARGHLDDLASHRQGEQQMGAEWLDHAHLCRQRAVAPLVGDLDPLGPHADRDVLARTVAVSFRFSTMNVTSSGTAMITIGMARTLTSRSWSTSFRRNQYRASA